MDNEWCVIGGGWCINICVWWCAVGGELYVLGDCGVWWVMGGGLRVVDYVRWVMNYLL